jgi:hypothetical protein
MSGSQSTRSLLDQLGRANDRSELQLQKPEPVLCPFADTTGTRQVQLESLILAQNER